MAPIVCEKPLLESAVTFSQPRPLRRESLIPKDDTSVQFEDEWGKPGHEHNRNEDLNSRPTSILVPDSVKDEEKKKLCDADSELLRKLDIEDGGGRKGRAEGEGGGGGGGRDENDNTRIPQYLYNKSGCFQRYRDSVAYWWLGFCNNFTYWVMITAAYDLLTPEFQEYRELSEKTGEDLVGQTSELLANSVDSSSESSVNDTSTVRHSTNTFTCQEHSTGAILVADTLPATALTLAAPLTLLLPINIRVLLVSALCAASYLTLGFAHPRFVFLGVALASMSRGFSDSSFLGYASHYPKNVLSMWSSGTGVATFIGPLLYSSLTTAGLDSRCALLVFLAIPVVTVVSFLVLSPIEEHEDRSDAESRGEATGLRCEQDLENEKQKMSIVLQEKLLLFMRAQKYILPLAVFYFIMYLTNQGLLELVYFPSSVLTHAQQYSWSNTGRCLGTLISRSAHTFLLLPSAWIFNILAVAILALVGSEAYYHYLSSEYIIYSSLFIQGLLEGAAFRSTIFRIHNKISDKDRAFCLGIFPSSLFLPALIAGLVSMPVHSALCKHHAFKV